MASVAVAAPQDSATRAIAARLARDRGASLCHPDLPQNLSRPGALAGFDAVVYRPSLLPREGGPDLAEAAALLAEVAAARPAKLVLLSSAAVYEPSHQQLGLIAEPRVLPRARNRISRRWLELEELARSSFEESSATLVVLRPAAVAAADSPDPLARLTRGRLALSVFGHDPSIQLLAPEDLAEAVGRAVEDSRASGIYHVAPAGTVPFRAALRLAGALRIALPFHLQRLARALLSRLGLSGPPEELAWARYPATISGEKIRRELGFTPAKTSAQAVQATPGSAPDFDDFGMDRGYIDTYGRTLFHFLHRWYWRVEVQGLEHVPKAGRAVLTGVHRGFMPWDGVMALHTVAQGTGRTMRFLIHPCLVKFPYLAAYMTKLGGIVACTENAGWVLERDGLLGMFPEGIHGAFTMYKDAYRLGKFGRDEYVRMALRNRAPIVPFVTVGSAEIYPILGRVDWKWWKRWSEWPFLPLTPTFPFLPFPLPSKWHTRFLPAFHVEELHPPEAADDPAVVQALSHEVRKRLEAAIAEMLAKRRSIFRGSIFGPDPL
jgi:1-acyl-sn-glycerol-3-phosphate acyltransferase